MLSWPPSVSSGNLPLAFHPVLRVKHTRATLRPHLLEKEEKFIHAGCISDPPAPLHTECLLRKHLQWAHLVMCKTAWSSTKSSCTLSPRSQALLARHCFLASDCSAGVAIKRISESSDLSRITGTGEGAARWNKSATPNVLDLHCLRTYIGLPDLTHADALRIHINPKVWATKQPRRRTALSGVSMQPRILHGTGAAWRMDSVSGVIYRNRTWCIQHEWWGSAIRHQSCPPSICSSCKSEIMDVNRKCAPICKKNQ